MGVWVIWVYIFWHPRHRRKYPSGGGARIGSPSSPLACRRAAACGVSYMYRLMEEKMFCDPALR